MHTYVFPCPNGIGGYQWKGSFFENECDKKRILDYSANSEGWVDALTDLHEQVTDGSNPIDQESRRRCLLAVDSYSGSTNTAISLLEIGSSSGYLLRDLIQRFQNIFVIGSDVIKAPLDRLAEKYKHIPLLRFDLNICPLPSNSIDIVVMLDVLEHIEDEVAALTSVHHVLKDFGMLYIEVPNGEWLYDDYDRELMHFRRYSDARLRDVLRRSGFSINSIDHIGFLVYPFFCIAKIYNKIWPSKNVVEKRVSATDRSKIFKYLFQLEQFISRACKFPAGIRTIVIASPIKVKDL